MATDVLEAHADLIPIRLVLDKHSYSATLRLLTLPPNHPLHTHVRKASRQVKRYRSPLHNLLESHSLKAGEIETIYPARLHPTWSAPFSTVISKNEEDAIAYDKANPASVKIYSDGSSIDGGVGATAVLFINNTPRHTL